MPGLVTRMVLEQVPARGEGERQNEPIWLSEVQGPLERFSLRPGVTDEVVRHGRQDECPDDDARVVDGRPASESAASRSPAAQPSVRS